MSKSVKEVLVATLDNIKDKNDWTHGSIITPDGCMCLMGSYAVASGYTTKEALLNSRKSLDSHDNTDHDYMLIDDVYEKAHKHFPEAFAILSQTAREFANDREYIYSVRDDVNVVVGFNDYPLTKHSDVVAMLEKAIAKAE